MASHDSGHGSQAKTTAGEPGCEERIKEFLYVLVGYPAPGIRDFQVNIFARFAFPGTPAASRLLQRPYRDGWRIDGLG